jgi:signal transduction histidine kinase
MFSTNGTEGEKGTGLGLPLCKEFVERNDGRIWVESKPGNGSKFVFNLKKSIS